MQKSRKIQEPLLVALSGIIQARREQLGMSQESLAAKCGLHRTYISAIERGCRNITVRSLGRLCAALDIALSELLKAAEEKVEVLSGGEGVLLVTDEMVGGLLDRLISELGTASGGMARQLMLEALWLKHKLADRDWSPDAGEGTVLAQLEDADYTEGLLIEFPDARRTASELLQAFKLWRRLA